MSSDLTRQSPFANLLYVVFLSLIFWSSWLLMPQLREVENVSVAGTPVGQWIDATLRNHQLFGIIISSLLVFVNSVMVMRLCVKNVVFLERSYMPALIYVIISAGYFNSYLSLRPLLVSTLLIIACDSIFNSYSSKKVEAGRFMKIGVAFGVSAIIYEPSVVLFPLLPIALIQFRLLDVREWFAAIFGFAFPIFTAAYIGWYIGDGFIDYFVEFYNSVLSDSHAMPLVRNVNIIEWSFIGIVTMIVVISIVRLFVKRILNKVKTFKSYLFFVWILVIMIATLFYLPSRSLYLLPILAIPLSVIITTYFTTMKPSFFNNFLYVLLICGAIALHLAPMLKHF